MLFTDTCIPEPMVNHYWREGPVKLQFDVVVVHANGGLQQATANAYGNIVENTDVYIHV